MKILSSFLLSSALLTSTAAIASASPYDKADKRGDESSQRVAVRDHRTQWTQWTALASLRVSGRQNVIAVDRKVDTLKLEVSRGQLSIKAAVIVFADGSRYVAPIGAQMRAGESQLIQIPGAGKRVAKIKLELTRPSKALVTLSAK